MTATRPEVIDLVESFHRLVTALEALPVEERSRSENMALAADLERMKPVFEHLVRKIAREAAQ